MNVAAAAAAVDAATAVDVVTRGFRSSAAAQAEPTNSYSLFFILRDFMLTNSPLPSFYLFRSAFI
jgi:hypothetical protein